MEAITVRKMGFAFPEDLEQMAAAIEAGKYGPSLEAAFRISHVFGVGVDDVFEWDEG